MKKKIKVYILPLFLLLCNTNSFAQRNSDSLISIKKKQRFIAMSADKMPTYEGGEKALSDFINRNFKGNCTGKKTFFQLIVGKDSSISNVTYYAKESDCDDEIVRLLEQTQGKWLPGFRNGRLVDVYEPITLTYKSKNKVDVKIGVGKTKKLFK